MPEDLNTGRETSYTGDGPPATPEKRAEGGAKERLGMIFIFPLQLTPTEGDLAARHASPKSQRRHGGVAKKTAARQRRIQRTELVNHQGAAAGIREALLPPEMLP